MLMWFHSMLDALGSSPQPTAGRRFRPLLLELENRLVPSFLAPPSFAVGQPPTSVAVEDFNGDSLLDLAVANQGSNNVSILLGHGDGSFAAARTVSTRLSQLAVGDFNGDSHPDLVGTNSPVISLLLGN